MDFTLFLTVRGLTATLERNIVREKFAAIVLAAGYSSRMGSFKPLLPLGHTTVLERVVTMFHEAGVSDVRVVVGYRAHDLIPLLEDRGPRIIVNDHYKDGMFSSIAAAADTIGHYIEAFFVMPVDIPLVNPCTLLEQIRVYNETDAAVLYPTFCGKRGHPPLISARLAKAIADWHGDGGLRAILKLHEHAAVDVEVRDEYILFDLDTPDDYRNLLARFSHSDGTNWETPLRPGYSS